MKRRPKVRAHANPLSESDIIGPVCPEAVDWRSLFPHSSLSSSQELLQHIKIADVGCGFGGLLVQLACLFPDKLSVVIEIRPQVVAKVEQRISELVRAAKEEKTNDYANIAVIRTNIMKYCPNYFNKHQLEKMFFCFPDPHFKKSNHRRRVINRSFLDYYAYALAPGGLCYTITDVKELHEWMTAHLSAHPLFDQLPSELAQSISWEKWFSAALDADTWGQSLEAIEGYEKLIQGVQTAEGSSPALNELTVLQKLRMALQWRVATLKGAVQNGLSLANLKQLRGVFGKVFSGFQAEQFPIAVSDPLQQDSKVMIGIDADSHDGSDLLPRLPNVAKGKTTVSVLIERIDEKGDIRGQQQKTSYSTELQDKYVIFNCLVHIQTLVNDLKPGWAIFFEFNHFKPKKKKVSTRCFAFLDYDELSKQKSGPAVLELYKKPTDFTRKRIKLFTEKQLFLHLSLAFDTF